jgi:hypothetical protein
MKRSLYPLLLMRIGSLLTIASLLSGGPLARADTSADSKAPPKRPLTEAKRKTRPLARQSSWWDSWFEKSSQPTLPNAEDLYQPQKLVPVYEKEMALTSSIRTAIEAELKSLLLQVTGAEPDDFNLHFEPYHGDFDASIQTSYHHELNERKRRSQRKQDADAKVEFTPPDITIGRGFYEYLLSPASHTDDLLAFILLHEYYHQKSEGSLQERVEKKGKAGFSAARWRQLASRFFSQGLEYNSDIRALAHLLSKGYSPEPAIRFMEFLHELDSGSKNQMEGLRNHHFRTHPESKDRASALRAALRQFMKDKTTFAYTPGERIPRTEHVGRIQPLAKQYDEKLREFHESPEYQELYFRSLSASLESQSLKMAESVKRSGGEWLVKSLADHLAPKIEYRTENGNSVEVQPPQKPFLDPPPKPALTSMKNRYDELVKLAESNTAHRMISSNLAGLREELANSHLHYNSYKQAWEEHLPINRTNALAIQQKKTSSVLTLLEEVENRTGKSPGWIKHYREGLEAIELQAGNRLMKELRGVLFSEAVLDEDTARRYFGILRSSPRGFEYAMQIADEVRRQPNEEVRKAIVDELIYTSNDFGDRQKYDLMVKLIKSFPQQALLHADHFARLLEDIKHGNGSTSPRFRPEEKAEIGKLIAQALKLTGLPPVIERSWLRTMLKALHLDLSVHGADLNRHLVKQYEKIENTEKLSELVNIYEEYAELRPSLAPVVDKHLQEWMPLAFASNSDLLRKQFEMAPEGRTFEEYKDHFDKLTGYKRDSFLGREQLGWIALTMLTDTEKPSIFAQRKAYGLLQSEFKKSLGYLQEDLVQSPSFVEEVADAVAMLASKKTRGNHYSAPVPKKSRARKWAEVAHMEVLQSMGLISAEDVSTYARREDDNRRTRDDTHHWKRWLPWAMQERRLTPDFEVALAKHRVEIAVALFSKTWKSDNYDDRPAESALLQVRQWLKEPKDIQAVWYQAWRTPHFNTELFRRTVAVEPDPAGFPKPPKHTPGVTLAEKVRQVRQALSQLKQGQKLPTLDALLKPIREIAMEPVAKYYAGHVLEDYFATAERVLPKKEYAQLLYDTLLAIPPPKNNLSSRESAVDGVLQNYRFKLRELIQKPEFIAQAHAVYAEKSLNDEELRRFRGSGHRRLTQQDPDYADRPTTQAILDLITHSQVPLQQKRAWFLEIRSDLDVSQRAQGWKHIALPLLSQLGYSARVAGALIREFYSDMRDTHVAKANEIANIYELDRNQMKQLDAALFKDDEVARAYGELLILQRDLKVALSSGEHPPEELADFARWLQGRSNKAPPLAKVLAKRLVPQRLLERNGQIKRGESLLIYEQKLAQGLDEVRGRFQSNPIEARAAFLLELVDPRQDQSLFAPDHPERRPLVFDLLTDGIEAEHSTLAKTLLEAYVDALDARYGEGYLFVSELLGASTGRGQDRTAAEGARDLLASRGSLWHKFGQMLGADPTLIPDDKVRETFLSLNEREAIPLRKRVYEIAEKALATEGKKLKRIKKVLAAGSVNVTAIVELSNGKEYVLRLLKHDAGEEALYERDVLGKMTDILHLKAETLNENDAAKVRLVANALEEYGHALTEKLQREADLRNDRSAVDLLQPSGKQPSYERIFKGLRSNVQLVAEADSIIEYRAQDSEPGADPSRMMLFEIVPDEKDQLRKEDPNAYKRFRRTAWLTEMEALFVNGRFDADGHFGNWRVRKSPDGELHLRRIDYSQAERLDAEELDRFKGVLSHLFLSGQPRWVNLGKGVGPDEPFLDAFEKLLVPIRQQDTPIPNLRKAVQAALEELRRENASANPVRQLVALKSKVNQRLALENRVRFRGPIQMAIKSVFLTQQLIDASDPTERKFMAQEFMRLALDRNRIQRSWIGALDSARSRLQAWRESKRLENALHQEQTERVRYAERLLSGKVERIDNKALAVWLELFESEPDLRPKIMSKIKETILDPEQRSYGHDEWAEAIAFVTENSPQDHDFLRSALRKTSDEELARMVLDEVYFRHPEWAHLIVERMQEGALFNHFKQFPDWLKEQVLQSFRKNPTGLTLSGVIESGLIHDPQIARFLPQVLESARNYNDVKAYFEYGTYFTKDNPTLGKAILERILALTDEELRRHPKDVLMRGDIAGVPLLAWKLQDHFHTNRTPELSRAIFPRLARFAETISEPSVVSNRLSQGDIPVDVIARYIDQPELGQWAMTGLMRKWYSDPSERADVIDVMEKTAKASASETLRARAENFLLHFGKKSAEDRAWDLETGYRLVRETGKYFVEKTLENRTVKRVLLPAEGRALFEWVAQIDGFGTDYGRIKQGPGAFLWGTTSIDGLFRLNGEHQDEVSKYWHQPLTRSEWEIVRKRVLITNRNMGAEKVAESLYRRKLYSPEDKYLAESALGDEVFRHSAIQANTEREISKYARPPGPEVLEPSKRLPPLDLDETLDLVENETRSVRKYSNRYSRERAPLVETLHRGFQDPADAQMAEQILRSQLEDPEKRGRSTSLNVSLPEQKRALELLRLKCRTATAALKGPGPLGKSR